jgi:CheY-like chemotaxis protein
MDILLVDDDDAIRETVAIALTSEGHRVESARDGIEALEILNGNQRPSLILLDRMMPVMDGEEFLTALRRDSRFFDLPVILISALTDHPISELSNVSVLRKPFDLDHLFSKVAYAQV